MSGYLAKGEGGCNGRPVMMPAMSELLSEQEKAPGYRSPDEQVRRYQELGMLETGCPRCEKNKKVILLGGSMPFGPSHKASRGCQSGSHPHCTCDTCF
jgi:hypothetical protein